MVRTVPTAKQNVYIARTWTIGRVGATVRTYTAQGEPDGEVDWKKAKLPESAPVVAYDLKGHPGIDVSGKTIYLKASDIYLADDKTVCVDLAVAGKKPGSGLTALGVRHGASKTEVTCIPSIPK